MSETAVSLHAELSAAVAAETAAAEALDALETAARSGVDVSPSELAEAAGALSLRRMRREKLEADVESAAAEAAAAERAEAIQALAARAASDPELDPARLRDLEAAARQAVQEFAAAVRAQEAAFGQLVSKARALEFPTVPKTDPASADGLVPAFVHQVGGRVLFGDMVRVRIGGQEYSAPAPGRLDSFMRWVRSVVN